LRYSTATQNRVAAAEADHLQMALNFSLFPVEMGSKVEEVCLIVKSANVKAGWKD
jgi:hypothetical protein